MEVRWLNRDSLQFLQNDYLLPHQTVENRIQIIGDAAERILDIKGLSLKIQSYISKGWISPSTPIWGNFGTDRGLPISCFNSHCSDSIESILSTSAEVGMMTKQGGGTSGYFGELRGRGSVVKNNGISSGSRSFLNLFQTVTEVIQQGAVRRGYFSAYIDIFHPDIEEWLNIRAEGDPIQHITWGICVPTWWIEQMRNGDEDKRVIWAKVIQKRFETGLPYIFFTDNSNNGESTPECYKGKDLIKSSNLCNEIHLPSNKTESFVCDLCSLNDLYYDEWKDTDCVEVAVQLLDAAMTEFIEKASKIKFMEKAVNFAKNHRAIGIGRLGYHSLLQSKMIPFESMEARSINIEIQKTIQKQALKASQSLSERLSECEWTKGLGRRHTTTCVTGDTKILTRMGQINISETVGKEIEIWNGSNWSKVKPFETGINSIYEVSFSNGMLLRCTKNHKFLISTPQRDSKGRFGNKTLEVTLDKIRIGDCVPKFPVEQADGSSLDLKYAYTSGMFCGDGSINNSRGGKYPRKELRLYGSKISLSKYIEWRNGKTWGKDCVRGYLPNDVLDKYMVPHKYSIKSKTEWLCGLIDSDGAFNSTGVSISMKDKSFATEVGLLIQSLGGEIMISECKRVGGYSSSNNEYYSINISLFSCGKIFQEIKPKRVKIVATKPIDGVGKGHWVHITKIENLKRKEKTYCFTEKEFGCGVFSGILTKQCAIAPTTSSGFIMGVSQSIEPYNSNYYTKDLAKGKFTIKNKYLESILEKYDKNTEEIWNSIMKQHGSVLHLDFISDNEKAVFKTAREISQKEIIIQAAQRQKYIDQGQSLNLFITKDTKAKEVNELMLLAHDMGLKGLYYQHNVSAASEFSKQFNCTMCE